MASYMQLTMGIPKLRYLLSRPLPPIITHIAVQRDRMFDIADVPFTAVPPEEMKIYTANIEKVGFHAGYKGRRYWASRSPSLIVPRIDNGSQVEGRHRE